MDISIEPGVYVVAVSGGVDSVVLLDVLSNQKNLKLIVAHFDHGMRADSHKDASLVKSLAEKHDLPFETKLGKLGLNVSEAEARAARYDFLWSVAKKYDADALITAHHRNDVLETMMINILRGTGRLGLTALKEQPRLKRPLIQYTKQDIYDYAKNKKLEWNEDETNTNVVYLRNYLRNNVLNNLTPEQNDFLWSVYQKMLVVNASINEEIEKLLQRYSKTIPRKFFVDMPWSIRCELMAFWLKLNGVTLSKRMIEDSVIAVQTALPNSIFVLGRNHKLHFTKADVKIIVNSSGKQV